MNAGINAGAGPEQDFIALLETAADASAPVDVDAMLAQLWQWQSRLLECLDTHRLMPQGFSPQGDIACRIADIAAARDALVQLWPRQWDALAPARELARHLEDSVLLLVFGKFNAGKSSLCNFLAERFAAQGQPVEYFQVREGLVQAHAGPLREGATETTSQLQGVRLGARLVLLDTPGLHSVTRENAELTRRFTDCADGVLWLTSSASPGQVQELEELSRELQRGKPLLPLITRSDEYEEDEIDGRIEKVLCNKRPDSRALQQADVAARACEKLTAMALPAELLRAPVSVSVHMARHPEQGADALAEAGFGQLYCALHALIAPALAYRATKPAAILLHHLHEHVLDGLQQQLLPRLQQQAEALDTHHAQLETRREQLALLLWRRVAPALPALLDEHAEAGDLPALDAQLAVLLDAALPEALARTLPDFDLHPNDPHAPVLPESVPSSQDWTALHAALESALRSRVLDICTDAKKHARQVIEQLQQQMEQLQQAISAQRRSLRECSQQLSINSS
ncbi:MAG: GTPase [Lysobacteraceae bacterium]